MKKLFYSMSIVALVLASCGDASGEAVQNKNLKTLKSPLMIMVQ